MVVGSSDSSLANYSSLGWDDLRVQARKLENEIDLKLAAYGRSEQGEDTEREIEQLLIHLQQANNCMQSLISSIGSDIVSHTLQRHINIFQDLTQEFRRKRSSAKANKEHAQLLETFRGDSDGRDIEAGSYSLQHEQLSLLRSSTQIDGVVNQAQAALTALTFQRQLFGNIGSKVEGLGSIFPSVNSIVGAIKRKKNRDTLILSGVISVCTFLIFLYWISK